MYFIYYTCIERVMLMWKKMCVLSQLYHPFCKYVTVYFLKFLNCYCYYHYYHHYFNLHYSLLCVESSVSVNFHTCVWLKVFAQGLLCLHRGFLLKNSAFMHANKPPSSSATPALISLTSLISKCMCLQSKTSVAASFAKYSGFYCVLNKQK